MIWIFRAVTHHIMSHGFGQHCFGQWLVAWWHQAITWTDADISAIWHPGSYFAEILSNIQTYSFMETHFENVGKMTFILIGSQWHCVEHMISISLCNNATLHAAFIIYELYTLRKGSTCYCNICTGNVFPEIFSFKSIWNKLKSA